MITPVRPIQAWLPAGRQRSHTTSTVGALCAIVDLVMCHCKASNSKTDAYVEEMI